MNAESSEKPVVIVGGGHAAGELSTSLREQGWEGQIVLIGEEPHLPYQRPPLSKAFFDGTVTEDALYLKPAATYAKAGVELLLGTRVDSELAEAAGLSVNNGIVVDELCQTSHPDIVAADDCTNHPRQTAS